MSVTAEALVTATTTARLRLTWRRALPAFLLLVATVLVAYRDTLGSMVAIWARSDTFMHGFAIAPIALWLIWQRRAETAALAPQPAVSALVPIACAVSAWLLGELAGVNAVTQVAAVAMLVLAVPAVFGWTVARSLLFPLGFLFFCVPLGEFLVPQLMEWTADFTIAAVRASGVPVYREGLQFVLPSGSWSVVDACSGVRYLIASLMVGTLFAYLNYTSTRRRLAFVVVAALVPIVANWLRAYMIVMLGHLSDNKLAAGVDHLIYGWIFFGVVILAMFAIGARWSQPPQAYAVRNHSARPAVFESSPAAAWAVAVGAALLVWLPHAAVWSLGRFDVAAPPELAPLRVPAGGWQRSSRLEGLWKPAFRQPSAESNALYAADGREVGVYIAYYRQQSHDRKLVSSENVLVPAYGASWSKLSQGSRAVELGGQPTIVRTARLRASAHAAHSTDLGLALWQTYWVDGRLTASDSRAKLYGALQRLRGHGDDAAAVLLYTRTVAGDAVDETAVLENFAGSNWAAIEQQLQRTRDAR